MAVVGSERNRLARTKGWSWDIPYCARCKGHVNAGERVVICTFAFTAISVVAEAVLTVLSQSTSFGATIFSILVLLGISVGRLWWWRIMLGRPEHCTGMTRAVLYLGSVGACHTFDFRSRFYAADFIRANRHKVVNANLDVASILRDSRVANQQVARRLLRLR